jgi:hypothetical protein
MQTQNRLLDDLARVASGALGVASGMREEIEVRLREQFERVLARMELVTREEFDAVRAMAVKAREEQETLTERVAALEQALAKAEGSAGGKSKGTTGKPAAKRATARKATSKANGGGGS